MHLPLNVLEDAGAPLAEEYRVGVYFPVFILCDAAGQVINRWTGYTKAERFINSFNRAMSDPITVTERIKRFDATAAVQDALFLAKYYSDTGEYLKSRDYYRRLEALPGGRIDYSFQTFLSSAEAVWNDQLPFDSLPAAADEVLDNDRMNLRNVARLAQIMGNVARQTGQTDRIEKYLDAGIAATATRTDEKGIAAHHDLLADHALHVLNDTTRALSIKKEALGNGWENDPARYFRFGEYCFQRKINLEEAERYIRQATNKASEGKFKARHLRLLAEICYARGKPDEATKLAEQALEQDPSAAYFEKRLEVFKQGTNSDH